MANNTVFIVEDEISLANTLVLNLKLEQINVLMASNGNDAIQQFSKHYKNINLVLLDVMLPGISGYQLFTEFKKISPNTPIIFLTAKDQAADKISGLKLGADDYIVKPFDLEELLLRIQNVLKRNTVQATANNTYIFNNCSINFETFEIKDINGTTQTLSKREIGLLKLLTTNVNKVISRNDIIDALWEPDENASSRTIDNYILAFRKYFELNPKNPVHFLSIRSVGYKFVN